MKIERCIVACTSVCRTTVSRLCACAVLLCVPACDAVLRVLWMRGPSGRGVISFCGAPCNTVGKKYRPAGHHTVEYRECRYRHHWKKVPTPSGKFSDSPRLFRYFQRHPFRLTSHASLLLQQAALGLGLLVSKCYCCAHRPYSVNSYICLFSAV